MTLGDTKVTAEGIESLLREAPSIQLITPPKGIALDHETLSRLQLLHPECRFGLGAIYPNSGYLSCAYWVQWLGGDLEIAIEGEDPVTISDVDTIPKGRRFQIVSVNFNDNQYFNDRCLVHFRYTGVSKLSLQNTDLTDAAVDWLRILTDLEDLDLTGTKITAEGIEAIKAALPECNVVWEEGAIKASK